MRTYEITVHVQADTGSMVLLDRYRVDAKDSKDAAAKYAEALQIPADGVKYPHITWEREA